MIRPLPSTDDRRCRERPWCDDRVGTGHVGKVVVDEDDLRVRPTYCPERLADVSRGDHLVAACRECDPQNVDGQRIAIDDQGDRHASTPQARMK